MAVYNQWIGLRVRKISPEGVYIYVELGVQPEEVRTHHVSDHALRFSSDVTCLNEQLQASGCRLSFCRNY